MATKLKKREKHSRQRKGNKKDKELLDGKEKKNNYRTQNSFTVSLKPKARNILLPFFVSIEEADGCVTDIW